MRNQALKRLFVVLLLALGFGAGILVAVPAGAVIDQVTSEPAPQIGDDSNALSSVSCVSETFCAAVGIHQTGLGAQPVFMSWNGTAWTLANSVSLSSTSSYLESISCSSAVSCVAVGRTYDEVAAAQTLTMSWDGTIWSVITSPNANSDTNVLNSVSCTSSSACLAVGNYFDGSIYQSLVMSWNGSTWSMVASPNPGTSGNHFASVSCISATSCVVVGSYGTDTVSLSMALSWDGTEWTTAMIANLPVDVNQLASVSCTSPTFCVAVGVFDDSGINKSLTIRWDGNSWTTSTPPNSGDEANFLTSVSCVSPTMCIAAGFYEVSFPYFRTLLQQWDGTTWSILNSPNSSSSINYLQGISCSSPVTCVAVGEFLDDNTSLNQSLTLLMNGSVPPTPPTDPIAPSFTG